MKVVFLDVDGVLCPLNSGGMLPEDLMRRFADMVNRHGYKVVLSSSWREYQDALNKITRALAMHGVDLLDYTPPLRSKHVAIRAWLDAHTDGIEDVERIENYVVLDDDATLGIAFAGNFAHCESRVFDEATERKVERILEGEVMPVCGMDISERPSETACFVVKDGRVVDYCNGGDCERHRLCAEPCANCKFCDEKGNI